MRDLRDLIRARVAPLGLSADREQKIVEEWSAELEEIYDALHANGLTDEEAWREVERLVTDCARVADLTLDVEPVLLRVAHAGRRPIARRSLLAALRRLRDVVAV